MALLLHLQKPCVDSSRSSLPYCLEGELRSRSTGHCQPSLSMATSSGNRAQTLGAPQSPELKDPFPVRLRFSMTFHLHASNSKVVVSSPAEEDFADRCLCSSSAERNCPAPGKDRVKKAKGASLTTALLEQGFSPGAMLVLDADYRHNQTSSPQPSHLPSVLFCKHKALDLILLKELRSPTCAPSGWLLGRPICQSLRREYFSREVQTKMVTANTSCVMQCRNDCMTPESVRTQERQGTTQTQESIHERTAGRRLIFLKIHVVPLRTVNSNNIQSQKQRRMAASPALGSNPGCEVN